MKSELDAKTIASLRAELQDLLESAYAAGKDYANKKAHR